LASISAATLVRHSHRYPFGNGHGGKTVDRETPHRPRRQCVLLDHAICQTFNGDFEAPDRVFDASDANPE
jgi:hypothetical protein